MQTVLLQVAYYEISAKRMSQFNCIFTDSIIKILVGKTTTAQHL